MSRNSHFILPKSPPQWWTVGNFFPKNRPHDLTKLFTTSRGKGNWCEWVAGSSWNVTNLRDPPEEDRKTTNLYQPHHEFQGDQGRAKKKHVGLGKVGGFFFWKSDLFWGIPDSTPMKNSEIRIVTHFKSHVHCANSMDFFCQKKWEERISQIMQGGPLPVISGVISPINGLING